MKLSELSTNVSKKLGRANLLLQKNSPEIFMGMGIGGIILTTVSACRATLKADEVLDHHSDNMRKIQEAYEYQDEEFQYPVEVMKRDKLVTYAKTGGEFTKLYAPTIALGAFSITCILVSNNILQKRYLGAVAAYNGVSMAFDQYRDRVKERYGEEVDYELRYGVRKEEIDESYVDENGRKIKKKRETVEIIDGTPSIYARYWEKYLENGVRNPNWEDNPEFNLMFLTAQQEMANHILHTRGHIFLNEVYDMIGLPHTQVGQIAGWVDNGNGDGYIDFRIYNSKEEGNRRFINGSENSILLDFNCDGVIWDLI